jgi:hypothetical protein
MSPTLFVHGKTVDLRSHLAESASAPASRIDVQSIVEFIPIDHPPARSPGNTPGSRIWSEFDLVKEGIQKVLKDPKNGRIRRFQGAFTPATGMMMNLS